MQHTNEQTIDARSRTMIDIENQFNTIQEEDKYRDSGSVTDQIYKAAMKNETIEVVLKRFQDSRII